MWKGTAVHGYCLHCLSANTLIVVSGSVQHKTGQEGKKDAYVCKDESMSENPFPDLVCNSFGICGMGAGMEARREDLCSYSSDLISSCVSFKCFHM